MSKTIRAILSAFAAAAILTGCGAAGGSGNCTYVDIYGVQNKIEDFRVQPDTALDAVIAENDPEPSDIVTLNDGSFTIRQHLNRGEASLKSAIRIHPQAPVILFRADREAVFPCSGGNVQNVALVIRQFGVLCCQISQPHFILRQDHRALLRMKSSLNREDFPCSAVERPDCLPIPG